MSGLSVPQIALVTTCLIAFAFGISQSQGKSAEQLLLVLAGIAIVLLELLIDNVSSMFGLVPRRSIREILLFEKAPLRDILIPIAYGLLAIGVGSFLRNLKCKFSVGNKNN